MKVPVKSSAPKSKKSLPPRTIRRSVRSGSLGRRTKRAVKLTLREMLLSRTLHAGFKVVFGLAIVGSCFYGAYAFIGTTVEKDVVVSQSEIVARIARHTELPHEDPEAVVRVQDPESLKKQAVLFENVKEGEYIVIYSTLAIVYDLRNDRIVALKSRER
jgi:hypothetical protein